MVEREEDPVRRLSGGFAAEERAGMSGEDQRTGNAGDAPLDVFESPSCVDCGLSGCADGSGRYPSFCETAKISADQHDEIANRYRDPEVFRIMKVASDASRPAFSEGRCRIEETMYYARQMGARRIGIASCSGVIAEARMLAKVLRANGFQVYGIACKVGAIRRSEFGIEESCCDFGAVSCDPLYQAQLLNEARCDLNIVMGLCVGHDILFQRAVEAPCTTLVVKDRALCHNPVAALHAVGSSSPYNRMMRGTLGWNDEGSNEDGAGRSGSRYC